MSASVGENGTGPERARSISAANEAVPAGALPAAPAQTRVGGCSTVSSACATRAWVVSSTAISAGEQSEMQ